MTRWRHQKHTAGHEKGRAERRRANSWLSDSIHTQPHDAPPRPTKIQSVGNTLNPGHGSTNVPYLVRRLKRDHPEIIADLIAGKYRSARAAGIAAGIVRVPTPLQVILRLLPRLDAAPHPFDPHDRQLWHMRPSRHGATIDLPAV